jgi:P4 family phage/plasmid primase-like protien
VNILPDGRLEGETIEEFERKKELMKISHMSPRQQQVEKENKAKTLIQAVSSVIDWRNIAAEVRKKKPFFYDKTQLWWIWNENKYCYEIIDEIDIMLAVDELVQADTIKPGIKVQVLEAFKREGRKNIPKEAPENWIQFKNKVVDIETMEESEARPEYFLTNPIPHSLGTTDETPIIDGLLKEWGDGYSLTLKQIIAFCCIRDYPLHRIFLLIGAGSNGKGTYLRLLNEFLGIDNIASTEMDLLISNQFHITKLHKKLCCQMSETNFQALKNTSMLKRLSGGDLIGFEYKNKLPFNDYNYAKIIIATNSLPVTHDKTDGFYRRWVIVDFKKQFTEKTDPLINLPESEYEGLARWCCNAIKGILANREFDKEGTIADRKERYESRSNPLQAFLIENYDKILNEKVSASDFYDHLSAWLQSRGHRALTYQTVRNIMKEEGYEYNKQRLSTYDNPVSVILNITKRAVPAVPAVPVVSVYPYTRETELKVLEQVERVEQTTINTVNCSHNEDEWLRCKAFIEKHPLGNAFQIDEVFGNVRIIMWLRDGRMMENPAGTYRII